MDGRRAGSDMKVRFYRGPMDGKVREVKDNEYTIVVAFRKKNAPLYMDPSDNYSLVPVAYGKHLYNRTRHTHPDGSVFFEWDQPKGTKF